MNGCLYMLTFPGGKSYIGMTSYCLEKRLAQHRYCARSGSKKYPLYEAMRKHGDFVAKKLVIAKDHQYLYELEQKAISAFGTRSPGGYNLTDGGMGAVGAAWTEEQRKAASKLRKGVPNGSTWLRGRARPPEDCAKISAGMMGHPVSEETRRKIGATKVGNKYCLGRTMSPEHKEKIAAAQRGIPRPYARGRRSEEARLKMSAAKIGNKGALGFKHPLVTCIHCKRVGGGPMMRRWHFERCKRKAS